MILLTLAALALLVVAALYAMRRYQHWRDQRGLRIRYEQQRRFCMIAQKGTKNFSHREEG